MDRMIYLSMSGAKATLQRQDVLSHNLANVTTNGFRAELQAFRAVPVDAFPDVTPIQVNVYTESPGLAAEDVEQLLTFPVESAMAGLSHARHPPLPWRHWLQQRGPVPPVRTRWTRPEKSGNARSLTRFEAGHYGHCRPESWWAHRSSTGCGHPLGSAQPRHALQHCLAVPSRFAAPVPARRHGCAHGPAAHRSRFAWASRAGWVQQRDTGAGMRWITGAAQRPRNTGGRFSMNERTPSW